jgi:hypothetical protein
MPSVVVTVMTTVFVTVKGIEIEYYVQPPTGVIGAVSSNRPTGPVGRVGATGGTGTGIDMRDQVADPTGLTGAIANRFINNDVVSTRMRF